MRSFGPYRVVRHLGSGGMGSVWLAEEGAPARRWVALKLLDLVPEGAAPAWRLARERLALGRMNHPNIAQVYDAGLTPDGHSYMAMEFIEGPSITAFAAQHALAPRERVALMPPVCDAVQHAHQRGVIHRDLKPSNVLVRGTATQPDPVVIDFGIAAALDARGGGNRPRGASAARALALGTPEYASPEQLGGDADVDGRADVYSLGALLFELLTERAPIQDARLADAPAAELRRLVTRLGVPAPSRVRAEQRQAPAADLDWEALDRVTLQALEKAPDQRYPAPRALADDLRRWLAGRLVAARDPARRGRGLWRWRLPWG
ncbi:MAG: serine/threonine-protein kinase [Planctomycetota bacterium]